VNQVTREERASEYQEDIDDLPSQCDIQPLITPFPIKKFVGLGDCGWVEQSMLNVGS
jgi:hypothetical protein